MYNPETCEIAKPSELLSSVKAIMSVLQGLENYGKDCQVFNGYRPELVASQIRYNVYSNYD